MKSIILLLLVTISINAFCQNVKDTVAIKENAKETFGAGGFIVSAAALGALVNLTSAKPSATLYYVCAGIATVGVTYFVVSYFKYRKVRKLRKIRIK